jgi:hypothetical protein
MLLLGSIPVAVLIFASENKIKHYASVDASSVFVGFWAMLTVWVVLDKGMDSLLSKDVMDIAWSFIAK